MGYDAIHYALNYLALWIAAQNYRPLYAITIFDNSGTLIIHLLFFIINHHLGATSLIVVCVLVDTMAIIIDYTIIILIAHLKGSLIRGDRS